MIQQRDEEAAAQSPGGERTTPDAAATRALAEAAERRAKAAAELQRAKELEGRGGLEPTRYGDWEVKGLASDF